MSIHRELGEEYFKCKIPKDLEKIWQKDIEVSLLLQIEKANGSYMINVINSYLHLLDVDSRINFLLKKINEIELDTFSRLILCESLKRECHYNTDNLINSKIRESLTKTKERMLNERIIVDKSYKESSYMRDYDFSTENILYRIKQI